MRARSRIPITVVVAVAAAAGVARAGDRVVLIAPPPALVDAARAQLDPWDIEVVVDGDAGAAPAGLDAARALAERTGARAVAWLVGAQLLVFDADRDAIATRDAGGPLDAAAAASLALSLKTMLRESWDRPPGPPPPPDGPVRVAVIGGARLRGSTVEPRLTLAADLAPASWPVLVGVRGGLGSGVSIHADRFSGTWADRALGVVVLVPAQRGAFAFDGGAGLSVHATAIHGVLLAAGGEGRASATNLGLDAEASAAWRRAPIAIGVRLAATWVPWRQTYSVSDAEVFAVSHLEAELGVCVRFSF